MNKLSNMTFLILAGILLTPITGIDAGQAAGQKTSSEVDQLYQQFGDQLIEDDVKKGDAAVTKVDKNADLNSVHPDDQDLVIQKFGDF